MKKVTLILLALVISVSAQTDLDLGDIAFTGYQSEGDDKFAFVLLKDIVSGTQITFTDRGWLAAGGFHQTELENTIVWEATADMQFGTQVVIASAITLQASEGNVSGDTFGLSSGGDQLFAFQGTLPTQSNQSNFLAAIQMNGSWDDDATKKKSAKPSIFTDGENSLFIDPEVNNAVYDCSTKNSDPSILRLAVNNSSNWLVSDNIEALQLDIPYCTDPLPVEVTTFTISTQNNSIELKWETATEVNNYGFEIQRQIQVSSIENQDKHQSWKNLSFVEGNGNSNSSKFYNYIDKTISSGKYSYRLKQIDIDGSFEYSDIVEVDLGLPNEFLLSQNYPNPFNPTSSIQFSLPRGTNVRLLVYNLIGKQVAELVNQNMNAGNHKITFDASALSSGIYYYKLISGEYISTKKMILLK